MQEVKQGQGAKQWQNATRNFVNWLTPSLELAITLRANKCAMMTEREREQTFFQDHAVIVHVCIELHIFPYRTLTHMTDLMTYPFTTSHISLKSQVFSSLLTTWCDPQRSVSPWSAWRREASAAKKIAAALGVPEATTKRLAADPEISHRAAQGHSAKTRHSTRHLTPWRPPQTPTAPQRQTTRGKTLLFCHTCRTKNFDILQPQNGPRSPKNLGNEPLGS